MTSMVKNPLRAKRLLKHMSSRLSLIRIDVKLLPFRKIALSCGTFALSRNIAFQFGRVPVLRNTCAQEIFLFLLSFRNIKSGVLLNRNFNEFNSLRHLLEISITLINLCILVEISHAQDDIDFSL